MKRGVRFEAVLEDWSAVLTTTEIPTIRLEQRRPGGSGGWREVGVVLLAAGMTFGQSYGGNNPGPIEREIEKALSIDAEAFNLLYSATSLGQMVMPFLVGPLIQRVGLAQAAVTLAGLVAVGQLLTSLAV